MSDAHFGRVPLPITMNIGVQRVIPKGFNRRCMGRIADLDDSFGRSDVRMLVVFCFVVCGITEFGLAIWGFTSHEMSDDPEVKAVFNISLSMSILFLVFHVASFFIVYEFTSVSSYASELGVLDREIELLFRRYGLYTILTQCAYISYLVFIATDQFSLGEYMVAISAIGIVVSSFDFLGDLLWAYCMKTQNPYFNRFSYALPLFTFTSIVALIALIVSTLKLAK